MAALFAELYERGSMVPRLVQWQHVSGVLSVLGGGGKLNGYRKLGREIQFYVSVCMSVCVYVRSSRIDQEK